MRTNYFGPKWYVHQTWQDRFRQWKIAAFLGAVIVSGLVQFGWQVLTRKDEE